MLKNLVLTGMMGVGKTSIGRNLAKKLNFTFVDSNEFEKNNQDISKIMNIPIAELNNKIKTFNIKKGYFDDAIFENKLFSDSNLHLES